MSGTDTCLLLGFVPPGCVAPADAPEHVRLTLPGLAALASLPVPAPPEDDAARSEWEAALVLMQNAVLAAHVQAGDVLPARFGGFFSGLEALRIRVNADRARIRAGLARVAGKQEYSFKLRAAVGDAAPPEPAPRGRDYMMARLRARDARARLDDGRKALCEWAAGALDAVCSRVLPQTPTGDLLMSLTLLTDRAAAVRLIDTAREIHAAAGPLGLSVGLSGPWPPYALAAPGEPLPQEAQR